MNLRGKVALITGGRRIGRLLALSLAERGASVALTYLTSRDVIEETVRQIETLGVRAIAITADLSQSGDAERAVAETMMDFGRLDILVNMASIFRRTPFPALVPSDFDAMIGSNLASAYHTSIAAARRMKESGSEEGVRGKIVFVGDWASDRPYKDYLPYLVAKGALKTLTLALAKELAPQITVNLVQPAMIDPPPDMTAGQIGAVVDQTPLKRVGTPEDLNRLILYLLEGTDFATGSCYRVDGGRFLGTDER
ncbi:MAG: SDR family oxidoreductase [Isosphaeraceae bacterium]|nr:SDR family oxidoreductase [Isosphaeraceae bacterium]